MASETESHFTTELLGLYYQDVVLWLEHCRINCIFVPGGFERVQFKLLFQISGPRLSSPVDGYKIWRNRFGSQVASCLTRIGRIIKATYPRLRCDWPAPLATIWGLCL